MTQLQANELQNGLYILHWYDDENYKSVAAVGRDTNGNAWFAPSNWINVPSHNWALVHFTEWVMGQKDINK